MTGKWFENFDLPIVGSVRRVPDTQPDNFWQYPNPTRYIFNNRVFLGIGYLKK